MSVQVRRRRETAAFLSTFVGAQGELIVDTTNDRVQVHDGATPGGFPAAKLAEVVTNTRTAVADAAYTALASDRNVAVTALTAARTITLPASSAYPTGTQLLVFDESGQCSAANAITIAAAGSDKINGATSATIATAYGYLAFESNGAGKWTVTDQTAVATSTTTRTSISDANYSAQTTDRTIAYTALTAARTVSLPTAASFPTGTRLLVLDETGNASGTNTITLAVAGSDTINGGTSAAVNSAYGYVAAQSNGSGKWTIVDQPGGATSGTVTVANGGTGATTASGARANLGAAASGSNSDITSLSGLTTALSVGQGGTGGGTATAARSGLGAAASGANSDITSLSGLTTALSVGQGGTGATSGTAALAALGAIGRTTINDASYTALATDRTIAVTALTAARTITLPASSAYPTGTTLTIVDESGACSATNTVTLARAGSDTINGVSTAVISTAYGYLALESSGAGKWTIIDQTPVASVPRGFISGFILSNDATTPNSVLDISAGTASDSTGAVAIVLSAFTKSTGGTWAAGSGANGMGTGLTVAASTWYHVFAIIKGGVADVYFDTSVTAANAPSGTTAVRRLGSIKTNASAQIIKFSQNGDEFLWYAVTQDIATSNGFQTTATLYTLNVPTGVKVNALISVTTSTSNNNSYVQSPDQSGTQGTSAQVASSSPLWAELNVRTNTSAQIQAYSQVANASFYEVTSGWIDTRGK